jgi:hypothetical protein
MSAVRRVLMRVPAEQAEAYLRGGRLRNVITGTFAGNCPTMFPASSLYCVLVIALVSRWTPFLNRSVISRT